METKVGSYGSFLNHGLDVEIIVKHTDAVSKDKMSGLLTTCLDLVHQDVCKYIAMQDKDLIENSKKTIDNLKSLFDNPIYVKEIPNEYYNKYSYLAVPWLLVTTTKGIIKIGWRSKVINIDWSESDVLSTAEDLFPDENVTKGDYTNWRYIHAWGYDKAREYISKILH